MKSKILNTSITVVILSVGIELISALMLSLLEDKRPWDFSPHISDFATKISEKDFKDWIAFRDPQLGWASHFNKKSLRQNCLHKDWQDSTGPFGERLDVTNFQQQKIYLFGDSFIYGQEVSDDETISHYLSLNTKTKVMNFGMGGYGLDQAVLRFQQVLKNHTPEYVVLGVYSETINRIVNTFRPFYVSHTKIELGFKPYFRSEQGQYQLVHPPEVRDLKDLVSSLKKTSLDDYWFQLDQKQKFKNSFPFSIHLVKYLVRENRNPSWGRKGENYKNPEAVAMLRYMIELFIATADKHKIKPVIVFLPTPTDVARKLRQQSSTYDEFYQSLDKSKARYIDLLKRDLDWKRYFLKYLDCHTSAYGNKEIADEIFKAL